MILAPSSPSLQEIVSDIQEYFGESEVFDFPDSTEDERPEFKLWKEELPT